MTTTTTSTTTTATTTSTTAPTTTPMPIAEEEEVEGRNADDDDETEEEEEEKEEFATIATTKVFSTRRTTATTKVLRTTTKAPETTTSAEEDVVTTAAAAGGVTASAVGADFDVDGGESATSHAPEKYQPPTSVEAGPLPKSDNMIFAKEGKMLRVSWNRSASVDCEAYRVNYTVTTLNRPKIFSEEVEGGKTFALVKLLPGHIVRVSAGHLATLSTPSLICLPFSSRHTALLTAA